MGLVYLDIGVVPWGVWLGRQSRLAVPDRSCLGATSTVPDLRAQAAMVATKSRVPTSPKPVMARPRKGMNKVGAMEPCAIMCLMDDRTGIRVT